MQPDQTSTDSMVEWLRTQIQVEHARCDAIRTPPPGQWSKSPLAEELRELAAAHQNLVFAHEAILDECERVNDGADLGVGVSPEQWLAQTVIRNLASAYADRPGYDERWRQS